MNITAFKRSDESDYTNAFIRARGCPLELDPGIYEISGTIPAAGRMVGANAVLRMTGTADALHVFTGAHVEGVKILRASTADADAGNGFVVRGDNVVLVDCSTENCVRGFGTHWDTDDGNGNLVSGTQVNNLVLTRCTSVHLAPTATNSQWGFVWDNVNGCVQTSCEASGHHLDGLKLRRLVSGFMDVAGYYHDNTDVGADTYAGGDGPVFIRTRASGNTAGIVLKQGVLDPAYGNQRDAEFHAVDVSNNTGIGMSLEQNVAGTSPLVGSVRVIGGKATGNGAAGLFAEGKDLVVEGFVARGNAGVSGGAGIDVSQYALGVTLRDCISVGNGQATSGTSTSVAANTLTNTGVAMTTDAYKNMQLRASNGTAYTITGNTAMVFTLDASGATPAAGAYVVFRPAVAGIAVRSKHVRVLSPVVHGADSVNVATDTDLDALLAVQDYGVLTYNTADDVVIENPRGRNLGAALVGTTGSFTSQVVLLRYSGTGTPALPCSIGSTYQRTDGDYTLGQLLYVKATGAANDGTGWAVTVIAL